MRGGAYTEDPITGELRRADEQPAKAPAETKAPAKKAAPKQKKETAQ